MYPTTLGLYWKGIVYSCSKHGEIISTDLHSQEVIDAFFHNSTPLECSCHNIKGEIINELI